MLQPLASRPDNSGGPAETALRYGRLHAGRTIRPVTEFRRKRIQYHRVHLRELVLVEVVTIAVHLASSHFEGVGVVRVAQSQPGIAEVVLSFELLQVVE